MKTTLVVIKAGISSLVEIATKQVMIAAILALCFAFVSTAQIKSSPILTNTLLAKAAPDECFSGIGQPYPPLRTVGKCPTGAVPKVNPAYVWGLTQVGTKLWFGTAANVLCLVLGGSLGDTQPMQTQSWVCEFADSQLAKTYNLRPGIGDWRPPRAYVYNLVEKSLTDVTPKDAGLPSTSGFRSAGAIGDTVFLAGPAMSGQGVNFFAFRSSSQQYLGFCQASTFNNIRQWRVINNVLYAGVGNTAGGGGVVRWNGSPDQPFDNTSPTCGFEVVGNLAGDAAFLTAYGPDSDRIAVSAWANHGGAAGVYISPAMNITTGLTSSDAGNWTQIWQPSVYEPDPVTAATYSGGAIAYWNNALYFGTMHMPGGATLAHIRAYGPPTSQQQYQEVFANTYRAISIWRIQNAETTTPVTQLLYGESILPKFDPGTNTFQSTPTGWTPLYGPSGFGNIFNNYTWTAAVFQNRLFLGTMDWSYLQATGLMPPPALGYVLPNAGPHVWGADLWRFDSPGPAVAENINGLGNYLNYGFRSMIVSPDGQSLFVGTANPMNLEVKGGWELRLLKLK